MIICRDTTHVIVHSRQNRNRLFGDINTSKNRSSFRYNRKPFLENFWRKMVEVQVDMVLQRS